MKYVNTIESNYSGHKGMHGEKRGVKGMARKATEKFCLQKHKRCRRTLF